MHRLDSERGQGTGRRTPEGYHKRIREDLTMVLRIMDKLCCNAQVYLPQSGMWNQ